MFCLIKNSISQIKWMLNLNLNNWHHLSLCIISECSLCYLLLNCIQFYAFCDITFVQVFFNSVLSVFFHKWLWWCHHVSEYDVYTAVKWWKKRLWIKLKNSNQLAAIRWHKEGRIVVVISILWISHMAQLFHTYLTRLNSCYQQIKTDTKPSALLSSSKINVFLSQFACIQLDSVLLFDPFDTN